MTANLATIRGGRRRYAFTLVELLVVIAIIGILVALLLPAIQAARAAAQRTQCQNNLKNIAVACLTYESSKGTLPPGSTLQVDPVTKGNRNQASGLGWPVQILPFIEEADVSQQAIDRFNTIGDAYANDPQLIALNMLLLPLYLCPSDEDLKYQREKFGTAANPNSYERKPMSYCGVSGSYFARSPATQPAQKCPPQKEPGKYCVSQDLAFFGPNNYDGLLIQGLPITLKQITDGTSKTVLIGERTYQIRTWMIGAYAQSAAQDPKAGSGRGATQVIPSGPQPLAALFSMKNFSDKWAINHDPFTTCYAGHDNALGDRPEVPASTPKLITTNDLPFGSRHPGGANFCYGDAGVKFLVEELDTQIYLALASRNGDEVVPDSY